MEAVLVLEDGSAWRGRSFGAHAERAGEVVFNTSMTGYQEILTDPSYRGQIVVMTTPHIGNYGTNELDDESVGAQVEGLVVRELSATASNWRASQELHRYLRQHGVPGIAEVDTRAITRRIRERGALRGIVSSTDRDVESLLRKARSAPPLEQQDLVRLVTCHRVHGWDSPRDPRWAAGRTAGEPPDPSRRLRCVAYDFGAKQNIFRLLWESGFDVTVVPADTPAADALALRPDGVFLSNGPGDPATATYAVDAVRGLVGTVPVFGICLGHQIAALALGARTYKLKFGHRGANHPVLDLRSGRVAVTSQNHGYAVDAATLPRDAVITHRNLNDDTCEGFLVEEARLYAVQYHPESSPGPHDSLHLFGEFRALVAGAPGAGRKADEVRR